MIEALPPAAVLITGAFIIPILRGRIRSACLLALPVIAFLNLLFLPNGISWEFEFVDFTLIFSRVDKLSLVFGYVFLLITFIGTIYALHVKESGQHTAAFLLCRRRPGGYPGRGSLFFVFLLGNHGPGIDLPDTGSKKRLIPVRCLSLLHVAFFRRPLSAGRHCALCPLQGYGPV